MGSLGEDMDQYVDEVYTKQDVIAGLKLISEFAGLIGLAITAGVGGSVILTAVMGPIGIPVTATAVWHTIVRPLLMWYEKLGSTHRRYVRAAFNAFNPATHLDALSDFISNPREVMWLLDITKKALKVEETTSAAAEKLEKVKDFFKSLFNRATE